MTSTFSLSSEKLWDDINEKYGVFGGAYRLFVQDDGVPKKIGRFLGIDEKGTLYIGKADSYLGRVIDLKKTICSDYKSTPHICGRRYNLIPAIAESFPYEYLHIELFPNSNPAIAEAELINIYFDQFGEVPPLNALGGKSRFK